jgi:hypothetical protein
MALSTRAIERKVRGQTIGGVEAMAGGAHDDDSFLTSSHDGLLGYTPPPA